MKKLKNFTPRVFGILCMLLSIIAWLTGATYFKWGCDFFKKN